MSSALFPRPFLILWLTTLTAYFSFQLVTASLPVYAVRLGADDAAVGLLTGIIAITSLVSRPWVGWWLDRGGARWGLLLSGILFALAAVGFLIAHTVAALIAFRMLSGLGIALMSTSAQVMAIGLVRAERRGEGLSLVALALSIGQGLAPALGIAIAAAIGEPGLFVVSASLGVSAAVISLSLRGAAASPPLQPSRGRLFHPAVLAVGLLMAALMITFGANFGLLPVHASRRGLANPGVVFAAIAAGQMLVQIVLRRVSDRFGRSAAIGPGLALAAGGMLITALVRGWWLLLGGFFSGAGIGMAQPAIYALGSDLVPPHERGRAIATLGIFLETGIALGATVGGVVGRSFGLGASFALAGFVAATAAVLTFSRRGER